MNGQTKSLRGLEPFGHVNNDQVNEIKRVTGVGGEREYGYGGEG